MSYDEYKVVQADIIANVTAPPEIGSWIEHIETFIILDSGSEASLLYEASQMANGQSTVPEPDNIGTCVPTIETAARGAALRAGDWIEYWEPYERERLYWEQFDEDDPNTWTKEDDVEDDQIEDRDEVDDEL
jgi:hypothetical protein